MIGTLAAAAFRLAHVPKKYKWWAIGGTVTLILWWELQKSGLLESVAPDAGGDVVPQENPDWFGRVEVGQFPVEHRDRAEGVDGRLQAFLDDWERSGPFRICVVSKGGLRTDEEEQRGLYFAGRSGAASLVDTPHGRGGAVDLAPYYRQSSPPYLAGPQFGDWGPFDAIGRAAQAAGLVWGGAFVHLKDGPHIEVPDWRSLPFPPSTGSTV